MDIRTDGESATALAAHGRVRRRHPMRWWRHHLAQDYDRHMRACLAKFELMGEARWFDAATGDAAAAIAIALKCRSLDCTGDEFDLAMTALTICALQGSAGASVVMSRMLRCLPADGSAKNRIANSWLMLAFAAKSARRNLDPSA
jgi:hypothetical protein